MHFGAIVENLIQEKDISTSELGKLIGRSKQNIYEILKKPDIHTELLGKICEVLGTNIEDVLKEHFSITSHSTVIVNQDKASIEYLQKQVALLEKLNESQTTIRSLEDRLRKYESIEGDQEDKFEKKRPAKAS